MSARFVSCSALLDRCHANSARRGGGAGPVAAARPSGLMLEKPPTRSPGLSAVAAR
jgi:hypothetical protein